MQGSRKNYTKRKHQVLPISSNKVNGFIASDDWWNAAYACRIELSEGYSFWKIFEISEIGMSVEAFTGKTTILAGIFASDINNT